MNRTGNIIAILSLACLLVPSRSFASSGTEGAAFLDIPVGAGPASLGAAYTALANDAYAATLNPGGLGFLEATSFSGQHNAYLESMNYEYLSVAHPIGKGGIGGSVQYLGSGDITGRDVGGNPTGDFTSYYAAYNLAYGRAMNEKLSLGLTGKMINAKLDDVSASAFAADLGSMYKLRNDVTLAATLTNLGSKLKFLSEGDSLPMAFHLGGAYRPSSHWIITSEAVFPKTGLFSFHAGVEWRAVDMLALRTGYRTDTLKGLSPLAGYTVGMGVNVWGQELAYAWLPYGDLGSTHYISLLMKFGEIDRAKRNLIQYQHIKKHRTVNNPSSGTAEELAPDYQQLMELLNDNEERVARDRNGRGDYR